MSGLIFYGEPKNSRESGVIYLETLLTLWFAKYQVPMENLESAILSALANTEAVLDSHLADVPVPEGPGPMERAMDTVDHFQLNSRNGHPIGLDDLIDAASALLLGLMSYSAGLEDMVVVPSEFLEKLEGKGDAGES